MIRLYLADDHDMVRRGLAMMLDHEPDMQVVGQSGDGWSALREIAGLEVDVLVLDLSMPSLGGVEVLKRCREVSPETSVLVLSMYPPEHWASQLLEAGALGYLSKRDSQDELVDAVRTVADGVVYQSRAGTPTPGRALHHRLSGRELQVFMLTVVGRSVMDIAAELGLNQSTVSTHLSRIRAKLKIDTVAAMVTYAHREGLIG